MSEQTVTEQLHRDDIASMMRTRMGPVADFFLRPPGKEGYTRLHIPELKTGLLRLTGHRTMPEAFEEIRPLAMSTTFVAGMAQRFLRSLADPANHELIERYHPDSKLPRALAPVSNLVPELVPGSDLVPNALYNLRALKGVVGDNIIVYGGNSLKEARRNRREIDDQICKPLGMHPRFVRQLNPVSGHGDALIRIMDDNVGRDLFKNRRYLVVNFGGDANSRQTVALSLLAMHACRKLGIPVQCVMPTTLQESPAYPLYINDEGLPTGSYHPKDDRWPPPGTPSKQSNVGVHVFDTESTAGFLSQYKHVYDLVHMRRPKAGYFVPGAKELKRDHIERHDMEMGRCLTLPISAQEEIAHTVKSIDAIPDFEKDLRTVLSRDREFELRNIGH